MKNILFVFLFLSAALSAQQNKKWNEVIALENEGKIKSADEIVSKIYKKAAADKDEVEMIKCFFYQSKYLQVVDENAQTKTLANLKTDINRVSIPSKAILNLVYAKCLNDYYAMHSYKIQERTNAPKIDDNFLTWSNSVFIEEINSTLKKTLENEAVLKATPLIKYEPIFDYLTLEKLKSQDLFDYIISENIALYKTKVHQWEIQKNVFKEYTNKLFGNTNDFIKLNLDFVSNENLRIVLSLYQKRETVTPSLENSWERIQFAKTYLITSSEEYYAALKTLQKSTSDTFLIQKIQLEKAAILSENASKISHSDYNIKAIATLDSILALSNRSNAYKFALQQKQNIQTKSLNAQIQKYSYPGENTRAFVKYRNVDLLKISFFKITQKQLLLFNSSLYKKDSLAQAIQKKQPFVTRTYSLLNKKDFFEYTTEVLLPQLETGTYMVYFESESDTEDQKAFTYETITSTAITALASLNGSKKTFQTFDRKTGKPLENVTIKSNSFTIKTGKNGVASFTYIAKNFDDDPYVFSTGNDTLRMPSNYLNQNTEYTTEDTKPYFSGKVQLYLDRAIYRPGQTVYYKGIAIQKKKNQTTVVPNTSFLIKIKDASYSDFKEFEITTNEFGSFSGEFVLPKTGVTGSFKISAEKPAHPEKDSIYNKEDKAHPFWSHIASLHDNGLYFRVEEYKRPKFEVVFEPKKESFTINTAIKVKGTAKAFAGSNISDAKVTYNVIRFTHYYRNYNRQEPTETVGEGETKTDASGKFTIDFVALTAQNSNKEQLPVYSFEVRATVTDSNGETHQANTTVKVGYHDLVLQASVPHEIETKDKNEILLKSTNLNGEFLAVKGEVKIYFVSPLSNKFKERVWSDPEIKSIADADFEKLFPFERISNSQKPEEKLVYSKKINTEKDKKIALDFISDYKSGYYKIVFSATDSFDNTIETISNFTLNQSKDKYNPSKLFTAEQVNSDPKKDGFVLVKLVSVIPELFILTTGNYQNQLFLEQTSHLENNQVVVKIPLNKEFQNNVKIGFQSIFENEVFNESLSIDLKTPESKLEFSVASFRNKIDPGSSENWSFKLSALNTKSESEIMASMYDSSLDQFATQQWKELEFREYDYGINMKTALGFQKIYNSIRNLNSKFYRMEITNETNKLIWFGFDFNDSFTQYKQREYLAQLSKKIPKPKNAKMISGIIRDQSQTGIPGTSITIKGTHRIAISDFDGYYEIEATPGEELVFSNIGYKTQSVNAQNKQKIDIVLIEDTNSLKEVVVTGYGSVKKKSMTGAVEIVQEDNNVYNTAGIDGLDGKVAGLSVNQNSPKVLIRGMASIGNDKPLYVLDGEIISEQEFKDLNPADILDLAVLKDEDVKAAYGSKGAHGVIIITTKKALEALTQIKARKNLSETAFFYPNLKADADGKVSFNFTSPEALTAWKLRLFAHNKDAVSGYLEKSVITQKEVMVVPNFPRFFREKDTIVISAKISNVTADVKRGISMLQFFDAATMQPIDAKMLNTKNVRNFTIPAYGNTTVKWTLTIPEGVQGVQYKIAAKAGNFSDGEENILPVLTNNMLVTESIPIWVREDSTKEYTLENLKNNNSGTLKNHQFTFEYTSNPSWIAIQSLPYLMEYEHECAEQTFARFYANALASEIISSNPKIASVFEDWRKNGKLNSKLEENEELKSIILAETPWLKDAQSEDEKKKNLALLFDLEKMKTSQQTTFKKLQQKQTASGGFSWFEGGSENEYITRHILAGLGHLSKLTKDENSDQIDEIAATGIPYLDRRFLENHIVRAKNLQADKLIWNNPYSDLHYLYTRSFYLSKYPLSDTLKKAAKLYLEIAKRDWLSYSLYEKGLAALTLNRFGESVTAKKIIENLKETASNNEDWGMYWIANKSGYYWHQAPIETQALLIEAFAEVNHDTKSVDAMKVWLLKNKQTKNWPTTKSTTEAVYALLMQGNDWLSVKDNTIIKIGDEKILTKKLSETEKEAGTGYIKLNWKAAEIQKEMASVKIENKSKVPGFGGIYWQYFEDLDKIKNNSGAVLSVSKKMYVKGRTFNSNETQDINIKTPYKIGDLVTVILTVTAKEDTEFVHLKDMRASCFEPVNVLSEYQYKGGLGYYVSTKDAATHFFFDRINKGTYVLEYDIRVNNSGEFSNGITTIQSMYAPEFASHTKGIRLKVN